MTFIQQLEQTIQKNNSLLCIGLDPDLNKFPQGIDSIFEFNKQIVDATKNLVCCYKPNIGFYSGYGKDGLAALKKTIKYIHAFDIPVLLDAKRGDLGNTAEHYVKEAFEIFKSDAVTANPYMGFDSLEPFLKQKDKGVVILCRTSNPSASDFQDLLVSPRHSGESKTTPESDPGQARMTPLYLHVAQKVVEWNKIYGNCLMVVGATWPEQLKKIREIAPDMFFLVPGVGSQGGDLKETLKHGLRKDKSGLIINSSRGILYASKNSDFAEKAREKALQHRNEINKHR